MIKLGKSHLPQVPYFLVSSATVYPQTAIITTGGDVHCAAHSLIPSSLEVTSLFMPPNSLNHASIQLSIHPSVDTNRFGAAPTRAAITAQIGDRSD